MSINPVYQSILGVIAFIIELTAMVAFLKAKLSWKQSQKNKIDSKKIVAILLFGLYGLYIFVAINSAIGFYSMELNQSNITYQENQKVSKLDENTYGQYERQIQMYQD